MAAFKTIKEIVRVNIFWWKFRNSLYAYNINIYLIKTPVASITTSIQDWNFMEVWIMPSPSRSVTTAEVMTLREVRVIWGHLLTSFSKTHHIK
jgi:hypothetical protein